MAQREILLPWDSQPQEAVDVNFDCPFAQGLIDIHGMPFGLRGGVTGRSLAKVTTEPGVGVGIEGVGFENSGLALGGTSGKAWATGYAPHNGQANFTQFALFESFNDAGTTGFGAVCGSGDRSVFQVNHSSGGTFGSAWNIHDGGYKALKFETVVAHTLYLWVGTKEGTAYKTYTNGGLTTSATYGATLSTATDHYLMSRGGNYNWNGRLYLEGSLNRAWSADEIAELWSGRLRQLFAPRTIWIPVSAGGGSTITATVSVSAAIQAARTAAASVNAAIQQQQSASASVNAAIAQARTVQASLDAAVLQARSATSSVDAAVQQALANTADIDAVIQAAQSASSGVNAAVVGDRSATSSVNAYVQAGAGLVASLDAYIQAGSSAAASVGAAIEQTRTGNATIDAVVQQALSATASLAAAVQEHRSATASINAQIQAGTSHSALLDAAIREQQSASTAVGAAVSVARSASAGVGAVIAAHASVSAAVQAAVLLARTGVASVGAYIVDPDAVFTDSEWWKYTVPVDSLNFTVPADDLRFTADASSFQFSIER